MLAQGVCEESFKVVLLLHHQIHRAVEHDSPAALQMLGSGERGDPDRIP